MKLDTSLITHRSRGSSVSLKIDYIPMSELLTSNQLAKNQLTQKKEGGGFEQKVKILFNHLYWKIHNNNLTHMSLKKADKV